MIRIKCYKNEFEKSAGMMSDMADFDEMLPDCTIQMVNGLSDIDDKYDVIMLRWNIMYKKKRELRDLALKSFDEELIVYICSSDLYDDYLIDLIAEEFASLEMV